MSPLTTILFTSSVSNFSPVLEMEYLKISDSSWSLHTSVQNLGPQVYPLSCLFFNISHPPKVNSSQYYHIVSHTVYILHILSLHSVVYIPSLMSSNLKPTPHLTDFLTKQPSSHSHNKPGSPKRMVSSP